MIIKFITFEIKARRKNELFQRDRRCLIANIILFIYLFVNDVINSSYYTMPCYKMMVD